MTRRLARGPATTLPQHPACEPAPGSLAERIAHLDEDVKAMRSALGDFETTLLRERIMVRGCVSLGEGQVLVWTRVDKIWALCVEPGEHGAARSDLSKAPLHLQARALARLPALLDAIAAEAERGAEEVRVALDQVRGFVEMLRSEPLTPDSTCLQSTRHPETCP